MTDADRSANPEAGACRSCRRHRLLEVIDLGLHPEANTLPGPGEDPDREARWPLRLWVCTSCWLVQLDDSGPQELALPGPPPYALSVTMRAHAEGFVQAILERHPGAGGQRVIDVASHGAYLHPFLVERGVQSLVVEGSPALAAAAARDGYPVLARPFGRTSATEIVAEAGPVDLLVDNYLLAHVADPDDFAAGLEIVLGPAGVAVLEFAHVLPLIADREFDAIRHGHFSYLSLIALVHLLARHGLAVFDVTAQPVYGGALRVFVAHATATEHRRAPSVDEMLEVERQAGLAGPTAYAAFARGVEDVRSGLRDFLVACRGEGQAVVGYGAPSRASTLLNSAGVTTDLLAYTVDRSPLKQGRQLPGCGIPIEEPGRIFSTRPPYVLILTWDIADEVRRQLAGIAAWGGRFVTPLPRLAVIPAE